LGLRISRRTGVMHWEAQRARTRQDAPPARQNRGNDDIDYSAITRFTKPNYALRTLAFIGTVMTLGAIVGAWNAQQRIDEHNARPDIEFMPTATGGDMVNIKARGLDRDITGLNAVLETQRHRADQKWTGVPCGVEVADPTVVGDAVQWQVNTEGITSPCDVRLTIGGHPYTYPVVIRPKPQIRVTREQIGPNRYHINVRGPIEGRRVRFGPQTGSGAQVLGRGERISEDWMRFTLDTSGVSESNFLGQVRVEGGAQPIVKNISLAR